jgi:hypothetical protein
MNANRVKSLLAAAWRQGTIMASNLEYTANAITPDFPLCLYACAANMLNSFVHR